MDHATSKPERDQTDDVTPSTSDASSDKQKLILPAGITPLHAAASIGKFT